MATTPLQNYLYDATTGFNLIGLPSVAGTISGTVSSHGLPGGQIVHQSLSSGAYTDVLHVTTPASNVRLYFFDSDLTDALKASIITSMQLAGILRY